MNAGRLTKEEVERARDRNRCDPPAPHEAQAGESASSSDPDEPPGLNQAAGTGSAGYGANPHRVPETIWMSFDCLVTKDVTGGRFGTYTFITNPEYPCAIVMKLIQDRYPWAANLKKIAFSVSVWFRKVLGLSG